MRAQTVSPLGIGMKLKGILLTLLILASLAAPCAALVSFKPIFDMSRWTTDTYPAFGSSGTLYDAKSPATPSVSTDLGQVRDVNYSPIFDMSPGAWSFNTYPAFTGSSAGQGILFSTIVASH